MKERPMDDLARALLEDARKRLVGGYPAQVRAALDTLTDDQVWWRANATSNSVGNLVLHVCGSTRHFLGRGVGGSDYQRDRLLEHAPRSEEHTSELQSLAYLVCRLLLEKKKRKVR